MSQEKRIIRHLQKFGSITNKDCNKRYGFRHLPSIIRYIKKHTDIKIYDWWEYGLNRFQERTRWKRYSIYEQETA